MRFSKDSAVVLFKKPLKDKHEILTLFTRSKGKISVLAYGSKSIKSRYRGILETLHHVEVQLYEGKGMPSVSEAKKIHDFYGVSQDLQASYHAFSLLEMVHVFLREEESYEELFDLFLSCLYCIEKQIKPELALRVFTMKTMTVLGHFPDFRFCSQCSTKLDEQQAHLSYEDASFHCDTCGPSVGATCVPFSLIKLSAYFQRYPFQEVMKVRLSADQLALVERMLDSAVEYFMERRLKSAELLV